MKRKEILRIKQAPHKATFLSIEAMADELLKLKARVAHEAICHPCHESAMAYCVQCEVRDINHQEKGACETRSG